LWEPLEVGRGVREPRESRESRLEHWIGRRVAKRKTNWDTRISISWKKTKMKINPTTKYLFNGNTEKRPF